MAGFQKPGQPIAPAAAGAALFATAVLFDDHCDIQPRHRADVGQPQAFGAQDFHLLQPRRYGRRDLHHAAVHGAGIGVNLFQNIDLGGKACIRHRVCIRVKPGIGALGRSCQHPAAIPHREAGRFRGPAQGLFADFGGMGIASHLALDGAQAKAFGGVIAGCLDAAIVQNDGLRAFAFKVKFAILGPGQGCAQHRKRCLFVKLRLEGSERGVSHRGLSRERP